MMKFLAKVLALLLLGFFMGLWLHLGGLILWAIGMSIYLFSKIKALGSRPRQGL
jgi:hypothetical protein